MKKFLYNLPSMIFSCIEGIVVFLFGVLLKLPYNEIILIIVLFVMTRMTAKKPCHYKSIVKCLIWTIIVFFSLFCVAKVEFTIAIVMTMLSAYILTENGDIRDGFEYNNKDKKSKYREMKKFAKEHRETDYFDDYLKILDSFNKKYSDRYKFDFSEIFKLEFLEDRKYKEILEKANLNDNRDLTDALDIISISLDTYIETKEIQNNKIET